MAASIFKFAMKNNLSFNCILKYFRNYDKNPGVHFLYTAQFLGLDKYKEQREKVASQFGEVKEKFHRKMLQYLSSEGNAMVFTEDLKSMVFLAEDNPEDIDICVRMMQRFNQQNKEHRFGSFVFGPVAMRLFYHLNKPGVAIKCLKDEALDGFFDQISSYHIAMDLLFVNKYYKDVIDIYNILKSKQLYGTKYPRECVVLVMASCYKLNTPESYRYAIDLIKGAREIGSTILQKGLAFAAALALNQNDPKTAMEILSLVPGINVAVRNLRLIALSELDRLDVVFSTLRSIIDQVVTSKTNIKEEILQYTVDKIQASVRRQGGEEMTRIFGQISLALGHNNHIVNKSLDELLCKPIQSRDEIEHERANPGGAANDNMPQHSNSRIIQHSVLPSSSSTFPFYGK